jgi:hypothetical protein
MADKFVDIVPAPYNRPDIVTSVRLNINSLVLFKSVSVCANLLNAANVYIDSKYFVIADEEYLAWNNDDQYLVNLILQKLGYTAA